MQELGGSPRTQVTFVFLPLFPCLMGQLRQGQYLTRIFTEGTQGPSLSVVFVKSEGVFPGNIPTILSLGSDETECITCSCFSPSLVAYVRSLFWLSPKRTLGKRGWQSSVSRWLHRAGGKSEQNHGLWISDWSPRHRIRIVSSENTMGLTSYLDKTNVNLKCQKKMAPSAKWLCQCFHPLLLILWKQDGQKSRVAATRERLGGNALSDGSPG